MNTCLATQQVLRERQPLLASRKLHILAVIVLFMALVFRVWVRVETVSLGYRLAESKEQAMRLDMERRELELQLSVLLRSDNLSERASERLGLFPPSPRQIVRVVEGEGES